MTDPVPELLRGLQALAPALVPGGGQVQALQHLSGGASQETWSFVVRPDAGGPQPLVLRRAPEGSAQRASGNASLEDEARLVTAAGACGVPVPEVLAVLQPQMKLGRGYVMRHVAGETLGRRIAESPALAETRRQLARQCGRALARIHAIDTAALPALRRAPARAELAHYEARHRGHRQNRPVFELALAWLREHAPSDPPALVLVHGDFRNGNIVVDASGLRAVLDWELAHLGDPMEDLAWISVPSWRFGHHDRPVGGIGTRDELFAGYREGGGTVDAARVRYWEVLGTLKWGVICEGMAAAHLSRAERSVERAAVGRRASETEIDLLDMLAPRAAAVH